MNAPNYFEIQADNLKRAKDFYEKVFGWKFTKSPNPNVEYWRIETEGIRGGLLLRPTPMPEGWVGTNAFVSSMEVKSFDETASIIMKSGGKVALPKFAVPGQCWQGYFLDPEGNTFGTFEVDTEAK